MEKNIIKLLNLNPEDVESLEPIRSSNGNCDYKLIFKKRNHICPHCGYTTARIKDYSTRKIKAKVFNGASSTIFYKSRRYFCPKCTRSFVEQSPLIGSKKTISQNTAASILEDLKPYNSTFSSVARKYNVSVTTVVDLFDRHVQIPPNPISDIMCWDEFYFNRHARFKYAFIMLNFKNKAIIDIIESRKTRSLSDYFFKLYKQRRDRVKLIIIDMNEQYRDIAHIYFKNAQICVDSFHVAKNVNDALNRIRIKIMKQHAKNKKSIEYRLLKYRRKLLFKPQIELDMEDYRYEKILGFHITEQELIRRILNIDPELNRAYELKEEYMDFNREAPKAAISRDKKKKELDRMIEDYWDSGIEQMMRCGDMFFKWQEELLNSFQWIDGRRVSNGPLEGKNSYVKKILSNANGFTNFERARNKIMYSQNHQQKYSIKEIKKPIKHKGKQRGKYKK